MTRLAVEASGIGVEVPKRLGIAIGDRYSPVFDREAEGFDVVLSRGEHVYGLLNVEYPHGCTAPLEDPLALQPLAEHLASALRNVQVLRESVYLRHYLEKLLERHAWNVTSAAKEAGVDRVTFYRLLERRGVDSRKR